MMMMKMMMMLNFYAVLTIGKNCRNCANLKNTYWMSIANTCGNMTSHSTAKLNSIPLKSFLFLIWFLRLYTRRLDWLLEVPEIRIWPRIRKMMCSSKCDHLTCALYTESESWTLLTLKDWSLFAVSLFAVVMSFLKWKKALLSARTVNKKSAYWSIEAALMNPHVAVVAISLTASSWFTTSAFSLISSTLKCKKLLNPSQKVRLPKPSTSAPTITWSMRYVLVTVWQSQVFSKLWAFVWSPISASSRTYTALISMWSLTRR